jgi:large subunit ribosomal protein L4
MEKKSKRKAVQKKVQDTIRKSKVSAKKDISSIPMFNSKGKEVGKFELDKDLFTGDVNKAVLYQAMLMYNANKRRGSASTKTRGDVSGGGKKPFRQKGTGRARAGSTRSPLWRGGGKIFGPHPRDFHYTLPKKVTRLALLSSLNSKINDDQLIGIDSVDIQEPKTKEFQAIVNALKLKGKSLFVMDSIDEKIKRASRNIECVSIKNYKDFNMLDVLKSDTVIMSRPALEKIAERFTK